MKQNPLQTSAQKCDKWRKSGGAGLGLYTLSIDRGVNGDRQVSVGRSAGVSRRVSPREPKKRERMKGSATAGKKRRHAPVNINVRVVTS